VNNVNSLPFFVRRVVQEHCNSEHWERLLGFNLVHKNHVVAWRLIFWILVELYDALKSDSFSSFNSFQKSKFSPLDEHSEAENSLDRSDEGPVFPVPHQFQFLVDLVNFFDVRS